MSGPNRPGKKDMDKNDPGEGWAVRHSELTKLNMYPFGESGSSRHILLKMVSRLDPML